jgi:hypothetical protein
METNGLWAAVGEDAEQTMSPGQAQIPYRLDQRMKGMYAHSLVLSDLIRHEKVPDLVPVLWGISADQDGLTENYRAFALGLAG